MVSACLPWYLLKGPVKRDFLEIYVTPFFGLRRFKNSSAMRVSFFLRISELNRNLQKAKKNWENIFCLWDKYIWKFCYKLSLLRTEYLLSAVNGSQDFAYHSEKGFQSEFSLQGSINIAKVLLFSSEQSLGPFTMLLVEGSSETELFRHLSNHVFRSP